MASRIDRQISELENIVERHLNRCEATLNNSRCILPRDHTRTEPHKFMLEFLQSLAAAEGFGSVDTAKRFQAMELVKLPHPHTHDADGETPGSCGELRQRCP
jgi:hypothetical protein